jgi:citronellol/citronellal dehydrogenase
VDGAASQGNTAVYPLPKTINTSPFAGFHREVTPDLFK